MLAQPKLQTNEEAGQYISTLPLTKYYTNLGLGVDESSQLL
jgi:hypothetical protein